MTAKEYLNRVRHQHSVLKQTERELAAIRSDILSLRGSSLSEKVTGTPHTSDTADLCIRLDEYQERVNREWGKLIDLRKEAKLRIMMLPDALEQAVLYARYINDMDWGDIGPEVHYSRRGVFKIHGRALRSFERVHGSALDKGV